MDATAARTRPATDAVARFCAASQANDLLGMMAALAPDADLVSPLSGRMVFRRGEGLETLLAAVYGTIRDLRWTDEIGDGARRAILGQCRIGPLRLGDVMVLELDDDGLIRRIRPHLRPWLATTLFALVIGARVAREPRIVARALRS